MPAQAAGGTPTRSPSPIPTAPTPTAPTLALSPHSPSRSPFFRFPHAPHESRPRPPPPLPPRSPSTPGAATPSAISLHVRRRSLPPRPAPRPRLALRSHPTPARRAHCLRPRPAQRPRPRPPSPGAPPPRPAASLGQVRVLVVGDSASKSYVGFADLIISWPVIPFHSSPIRFLFISWICSQKMTKMTVIFLNHQYSWMRHIIKRVSKMVIMMAWHLERKREGRLV